MRKSVLLGILILLVVFFGIKGMLTGFKHTGLKHSGNCSMHELKMEVKVIDHLSESEEHADICVTGNGVLIIKELTAKTATVYTDSTDILVIIKESNAQIKLGANNTKRQFLLANYEPEVNVRALEQFILNNHLWLGDKYPGYHEGRKALEPSE